MLKTILLLTEIPFLLLLDCYSCQKEVCKFERHPITIVISDMLVVHVSVSSACTWTTAVNHGQHLKILGSVNPIKRISC